MRLTEIRPSDKEAYLRHLAEREIYERTVAIPYPYTAKDADWWLAFVAEERRAQGRDLNWALRDDDGFLIGGIGFHGLRLGKTHKAELGYWLAKPWWGRGLMTKAVGEVCALGFAELGLIRIEAHVMDFNAASARVLEKCGFALEGTLRKYYLKDGRYLDARVYARLKV